MPDRLHVPADRHLRESCALAGRVVHGAAERHLRETGVRKECLVPDRPHEPPGVTPPRFARWKHA